jgi:hypothetical protein
MYSLEIRIQDLVVYSKLHSIRKTSLLLDIHFSSISRWFSKESIIVDSIHSFWYLISFELPSCIMKQTSYCFCKLGLFMTVSQIVSKELH